MTSQKPHLAKYCRWLGPALAAATGIALLGVWQLPAWVFMWVLAFAIFAGFKWLTYCDARVGGLAAPKLTRFLYLFCWPGMSLKEFARTTAATQQANSIPDWIGATAKTLIGAGLVWYAVPRIPADVWLVRGWVGMVGIIMMLHFGTFHLLALALQACGFNARPNMQAPLLARSLADFWGKRWNTAFNVLADRYGFRLRHHASALASPSALCSSRPACCMRQSSQCQRAADTGCPRRISDCRQPESPWNDYPCSESGRG